MSLNINLTIKEDKKVNERVKEAARKKELKEYQPSLHELFFTGYETHTGKHKPGIYQTKLSDPDRRKIDAVFEAITGDQLSVGVDDMKKFTKAHCLRLYQNLVIQNRENQLNKMLRDRPENYLTITTVEQFQEMLGLLKYESLIAVDTETTGLDYIDKDNIVGISLSLPTADKHYYVPFGHTTDEQQLPERYVLDGLKPILENPKYKAVYHNAKFDLHMFIKAGINAARSFHFCTMIGFSLLNENEPSFALKNLATKYGPYFGFEDKSATFEELFGKDCKFNTVEIKFASVYAIKDTHLTLEMYKFIQSQYDKLPELREYYETIERDITLVSVHMEQAGFLIDLDFAREYAKELEEELTTLREQIANEFGDININSPQQLADVLYNKLKLPDVSKKQSTDAKTLKILAKENKGCELLLQYRDLNKLLTTYITPLPEKVAARDQRLHGTFNQSGTVTGRFSSNNPNLQNLPKKARKLIVAGEGKLILGIDFSQIEPRVLADMSKDEKFSAPYLTGRDLYSEIASNVFNKPLEECGDGSVYRKQSKVILLGVTYGMADRSLAEMLGIPVSEAKKFIDDFFKSYPDVTAFMQQLNDQADSEGFVNTLFKRKRRFLGHTDVAKKYKKACENLQKRFGEVPADIWGSSLPYDIKRSFWDIAKPYGSVKRQSVNSVIQGSATEVMKIAMIKLWEYLIAKGWRMLATVHDEVLLEVPETITLEEVEELENIMAGAVKLDLPIKVDTEIMKTWGLGISKKEWVENGFKIA